MSGSVLSYTSWLTSSSMLTSDQTWSAPLANAVDRQLSSKAISSLSPDDEGGSISIDIDFGEVKNIGCIALLGTSGMQTGTTTLYISWTGSGGGSFSKLIPGIGSTGEPGRYRDMIFILPNRIDVDSITLTFASGSQVLGIGRIWVGPIFGQGLAADLTDVPQIEAGWKLETIDGTVTDSSVGLQAYAKGAPKVRHLTCAFPTLTLAQAIGGSSVYIHDLQYIGETYGSQYPMIMVARTEAGDDFVDFHIRNRTLVYGRQVIPWQTWPMTQVDFRCDMKFIGEA